MDFIQHSPVTHSEPVARLTGESCYIIVSRVGILSELVNFANKSFRYFIGYPLEHFCRAGSISNLIHVPFIVAESNLKNQGISIMHLGLFRPHLSKRAS